MKPDFALVFLARTGRLLAAGAGFLASPERCALAAETAMWALALPLLKYLLPLPRLARLMWANPVRPAAGPESIWRIATAIQQIHSLISIGRAGTCLERSLIIYRELARWGAAPRLVVGLQRTGDRVLGHAWVLVDGCPVAESASAIRGFDPVVVFGEGGVAEQRSEVAR